MFLHDHFIISLRKICNPINCIVSLSQAPTTNESGKKNETFTSTSTAISAVILSLGANQDAVNVVVRIKGVAILILLSSVVLPISDTGSDIALTAEWLQSGGDEKWFGEVSLAIIVVSAFIPACAMLLIEWAGAGEPNIIYDFQKFCYPGYLYNEESGNFAPALGFFLSMTELRLPVTALIQVNDIRKNGVTDKYIKGPSAVSDEEAEETGALGSLLKMFTPGASIIIALRLFEYLGETTLELLLQTYVHQLTIHQCI